MKQHKEDWIKQLPELDRDALLNLVNDGSALDTPPTMVFCLYDITNQDQSEGLTEYLQKNGFTVSVSPDPEIPGSYMAEAVKESYVISAESYIQDTALMNRLTALYGVHYDGWYASR